MKLMKTNDTLVLEPQEPSDFCPHQARMYAEDLGLTKIRLICPKFTKDHESMIITLAKMGVDLDVRTSANVKFVYSWVKVSSLDQEPEPLTEVTKPDTKSIKPFQRKFNEIP